MASPRNPRGRSRAARAAKPVKPAAAGADNRSSALMGPTELGEIRRLIRLVQRTGIGELEISSGGRSVRISAFGATAQAVPAFTPAPAPGSPAGSAPASVDGANAPSTAVAITSPMVGTFYRAPAPEADPYVEVGDRVEVGQTVCIIEAMKLMNEIEAEMRGTVVKVLVDNAQPVEYGQPLFLVEPA